MKRIGILSDTHGIMPSQARTFFSECDEIWHAGDLGAGVLEQLRSFKPTRAVYGNIDGPTERHLLQKVQLFSLEGQRVLMTHIGGYPKHYERDFEQLIKSERPSIIVCGHSHILKVMYDKDYKALFINPGAAGRQGFHNVCTLVRFVIDTTPKDLEVMDYPKYSNLPL